MIASDELQRISDLIKKFKYQFLPESDDEELSEYEILSLIFLGTCMIYVIAGTIITFIILRWLGVKFGIGKD